MGIVTSLVQPLKATIGSTYSLGGRETKKGGVFTTAVQPFKATVGSRLGSIVEVWEMVEEGGEGKFVDGMVMRFETGGWWLVIVLDECRFDLRVRLLDLT